MTGHRASECCFSIAGIIFVAFILYGLYGCATVPPAAATNPASHPFTNVNSIIRHTQTALEPINVVAFVAFLVALGLLIYGAATADKPIEHIGLIVAAIAGTVALGTLLGLVALPFVPWIALGLFLAGVGYCVYLLVHKYVTIKPLPQAVDPAVATVLASPKT